MIITQEKYNGDFIHKRFAYEQFRKEVSPVGNIVAFRAPMDVTENPIDLEDTLSDDLIAKFLSKRIDAPIEMDGDDLMVQKLFVGSDGEAREEGKVSVSITYSLENVAVGHTAINIIAGQKAPGFAFSSELSDEEAQAFMQEVIDYFNAEVKDQFVATTKIVV